MTGWENAAYLSTLTAAIILRVLVMPTCRTVMLTGMRKKGVTNGRVMDLGNGRRYGLPRAWFLSFFPSQLFMIPVGLSHLFGYYMQ